MTAPDKGMNAKTKALLEKNTKFNIEDRSKVAPKYDDVKSRVMDHGYSKYNAVPPALSSMTAGKNTTKPTVKVPDRPNTTEPVRSEKLVKDGPNRDRGHSM